MSRILISQLLIMFGLQHRFVEIMNMSIMNGKFKYESLAE